MLLKLSNRTKQYIYSATVILLLTLLCFLFREYIHYYVVALIFLVAVSILAIVYDIIPVLITALLSGFILNFFFINPVLHYKIQAYENILLFFIYLFIALVGVLIINKIRKQEIQLRDEVEKEKTINLYNTLLNSLSHELRTPIATIIGSVDTLKDTSLSTEYKNELLNEIEIAALRLNQQVGNLLNMSRLETGNLVLKKDWCDVNELIYLVIQKLINKYAKKIVFSQNDQLPYVKLDGGLIEQVIYVLLHNALIYTPDTAIVEIATSIIDDKLQIIVKDNGLGIPKEEINNVFDKFYRLPKSKAGGSGLGLSIAKGFVDAHGGNILLNLPDNGGTEFIVTLPSEISYINSLKNE
ncbi:MAG: PAS domain-containing sensor histidine kinase [Crocinitomicaceae bacterium]|nr:PAS domain-containing sensor histidine kinase [Crocinitomicaceae bacterium]